MPFLSGASPLVLPAADLPERETTMRKFALAVMLTLLLAGCSAAKLIPGPDEENSSPPANASVPASVSQPESALPEKSESAPPEKAESAPAESAPPETAAVPSASQAETACAGTDESFGQPDPFDAAQAVTVEVADGGIRVTFEQLPETAQDLEALLALYPPSDARHTGAFFIASLVRYVNSADDGLAMIDLLRGPRPMNDMDKDFVKDRLRDKTYLPRAYFEGAKPDNDYTPDTPLTLLVYDDPMKAEEGYLYIQVATTGADSRRRITLREKDGQYYLWEYSNVLTGIRLPASQDPWS